MSAAGTRAVTPDVLTLRFAPLQPLRQVFDDIHNASAKVGVTTRVLLAGDARGHVPAHLEEADAAMRELVAARCGLWELNSAPQSSITSPRGGLCCNAQQPPMYSACVGQV